MQHSAILLPASCWITKWYVNKHSYAIALCLLRRCATQEGGSIGGSITRPLVLFDPLSYAILSTSIRRGWGGVFHVITEFVMMLVVGLVEGCLSLSEMEPLTVRSLLILPCIDNILPCIVV